MLIDHAKIQVTAGDGGKGCQSLFKDIFNRRGIPDGGPGGPGGDIVIISDTNLTTLLDFKYPQRFTAERGTHGGSNHKAGKRGKDTVLKVPPGTLIKDAENGLVIRDLAASGERVVVARGGAGGRGNSKRFDAEPGEKGESRTLFLELKMVADVGLIGLPNAGKSTLINKISATHSKIAPYPFTTKNPILGVVRFNGESFVVADMPGLIEGAHRGRGLGDEFLKHIERTEVLAHVVDMAPFDGSKPAENFRKIEKELKLYDKNVYNKERIIVANKMDVDGATENLKKFSRSIRKKVWPISALMGDGVDKLVEILYEKASRVKQKNQENNRQNWDESPDHQRKPY